MAKVVLASRHVGHQCSYFTAVGVEAFDGLHGKTCASLDARCMNSNNQPTTVRESAGFILTQPAP